MFAGLECGYNLLKVEIGRGAKVDNIDVGKPNGGGEVG
jgi:hypothetical protein